MPVFLIFILNRSINLVISRKLINKVLNIYALNVFNFTSRNIKIDTDETVHKPWNISGCHFLTEDFSDN